MQDGAKALRRRPSRPSEVRKMRTARFLLWVGLVALPVEAGAEASAACLTRDEADALMIYALPTIVDGLRKQCLAALPATAPLIEAGPVMAARYRPDADKAWPLARKALDKMLGTGIASMIREDASKTLLDAALSRKIAEYVKPADCPVVDRIGDTLQPLPAHNMAVLVSSLIELLARKNDRLRLFSICPDPAAQ